MSTNCESICKSIHKNETGQIRQLKAFVQDSIGLFDMQKIANILQHYFCLTLIVLSDEPLTILESSNCTHEIPGAKMLLFKLRYNRTRHRSQLTIGLLMKLHKSTEYLDLSDLILKMKSVRSRYSVD